MKMRLNYANIISKLSKDAKIAVLAGGMSSEREISMRSGKGCFEALKRLGFINAELVEVDKNIAETLKLGNFDAAYNALHGKYGEDGCTKGFSKSFKFHTPDVELWRALFV